jgi:hypothetical protein
MLGGVDKPTIDREEGNTIDECPNKAHLKQKKAVDGMCLNVKYEIGGARVIIKYHNISVNSFGAFY